MLQLSSTDRDLIDDLLDFEVLDDIEKHRIDRTNGVILVCCADGDQFHDLYTHECGIQLEQQRSDPRIHPLTWNGGAMVCAENSPINDIKGVDVAFLRQISTARKMKNISPVLIKTHAPCGAANLYGIDLITQLSLHMKAKARVKFYNPDAVVKSYFHVDFGNKKRTFFFSRPKWEEWIAREGQQFSIIA